MANAVIGARCLVGNALVKQTAFDTHYRSANICDIDYKAFDRIVCAGAPAQKMDSKSRTGCRPREDRRPNLTPANSPMQNLYSDEYYRCIQESDWSR